MKEIRDRLFELRDEEYAAFNKKLIPNIASERIIGVRTPVLRTLAKELSQTSQGREFLSELPHDYFEEYNLHGFIVDRICKEFDEAIIEAEKLLPYIDNWATCDSFSPRAFKKGKRRLYEKTLEWLENENPYAVRFGIVNQMQYFLDGDFKPEMLDRIADIHSDEYYINMAIAWYLSYALIKQYDSTVKLFENRKFDKWVHNKGLQKAIESCRIDEETKKYLRELKISRKG